jgi:ketosteroid isomerase-like protein
MKVAVRAYLKALEAGDVPGVLATFSPDAWVMSPFLGRVSASDFFPKVVASSSASKLTVHDVFESVEGHLRAVGYFRYDWWLKDGQHVQFECADVFNFNADGLIDSMIILYDTHPIRESVGDKYA